jgi:tetratricopeptide (TPR) repeat protein
MSREKQRRASIALVELQLRNGAEPGAAGPLASDYQRLAEEHAGTRAGARAQLLAAGMLFGEGNYEEARQAFVKAETLLEDDALRAGAAFGVAASLDALDRVDEAQQAYQRVLVQHATAAVAGQARLALAGLYEQQGELEQALRSYSELTNVLGSPWGNQARDRHQELLQRHPELAPRPAEPSPDPIVSNSVPASTSATNVPAAE